MNNEKPFHYTADTLKIFWRHARKYRWHFFVISASVAINLATEMYRPFLYKNLLNLMSGSPPAPLPAMVRVVWAILAVSSVGWLCWRIINWSNNFFQARVMSDLLSTCYRYLQDHSYGFFTNSFVGSLVTKTRRYERAFETIADQVFFGLGRTAITITLIVAILFARLWPLGVACLAWVMLYVGFTYFFSRYKLTYDIQKAEQDTKTTARLADTLTNNINVKLFAAKQREIEAFTRETDTLFALRQHAWNLGGYSEAFQGGSMIGLEFVMIYMAVFYWHRGVLSLGDFLLIQAYVLQIFDRLWDLGRQIRTTYESIADANEMTQILLTPHEVVDAPKAGTLTVANGEIRFNSVWFGYRQGAGIFKNFNLTIEPGERVALVGPSGGGKTTIVKMLLRFMDIQRGEILVDGQNIAEVTQDSLRSRIALVPQEPILFHRSLLENICYAKPGASREEAITAAKLAHCHEFISTFPEKYETLVGERGVKLSGGERQRVAIARAILMNAPVLVLDEATSSLDSESEKLIQDALKNLMRGKTTVVIAHRLSTIMQMDRIVVIEHGKITEEGSHDELLKAKQGTYQKLWEIQAGGFTA